MCHNVTSDDAVELRFEDETVVVYRDVTYNLFGQEIHSHRTLDGRNVLQFYQQHCSEISPLGWLKLFLVKSEMAKSFIKFNVFILKGI